MSTPFRPGPPPGGPRPAPPGTGPRPGPPPSGGPRPGPTAGFRPGPAPEVDPTDGDDARHPAVDAAVRAIVNASALAPADQIPHYEAAYQTLRETLATIDQT
ncbi:hypothetical protein [Micromonospora cathayae]|uniref:Uncharacterized protein n=1 Tax=Micromonospora cathayae TaxID=3028804 RepID=A0ABY7ZJD3_9ACTN|nr:hypothetical protein [Micromonospora sp. HUAS 3]WDZ82392.1 hypothetical protein PVK37_18065 [Micromonospora sp. HUAS 3]